MLDIKKIKENPDAIKAGMKAKEDDIQYWPPDVNSWLFGKGPAAGKD